MDIERYTPIANDSRNMYEFLSTGPKGSIRKIVKYTEIYHGVYNLGFGDWDETNQAVNDEIRSNNNDRDKVLATVSFTVIDFMAHHQGAILFGRGSTPAKTRLYQMGIQKHLNAIEKDFEVKGLIDGKWINFEKGKNFQAFMVSPK